MKQKAWMTKYILLLFLFQIILFSGIPSHSQEHCESLSKAVCKASRPVLNSIETDRLELLDEIRDRLSYLIIKSFPIQSAQTYKKLKMLLPKRYNAECIIDGHNSEQNNLLAKSCIENLSRTLANVVLTYEEYYERELGYLFNPTAPVLKNYSKSKFIRASLIQIRHWIIEQDFYKAEEKRIKESFDLVKKLFKSYLLKSSFEKTLKDRALKKLATISLDNSSCFGREDFFLYWSDESITVSAEYDRVSKSVSLCPSIASSIYSDYSYIFILAHEIAHAFDPCRFNLSLSNNKSGLSPQLNKCLMHPKSIHSRPIDQKYYYVCNQTHLSEAFADWFGGEILGEAIAVSDFKNLSLNKKLESLVLGLRMCDAEQMIFKMNDHHHAKIDVLDKIVSQNPKVKTALACDDHSSEYAYCDGQKEVPVFK